MKSKERVLTTFACQEAGRVPVNYGANAGIDARLKKAHFGLKPDEGEALLRALGVDFRNAWAPYVGPRLHEDIPKRGGKVDNWGIHRRWIGTAVAATGTSATSP